MSEVVGVPFSATVDEGVHGEIVVERNESDDSWRDSGGDDAVWATEEIFGSGSNEGRPGPAPHGVGFPRHSNRRTAKSTSPSEPRGPSTDSEHSVFSGEGDVVQENQARLHARETPLIERVSGSLSRRAQPAGTLSPQSATAAQGTRRTTLSPLSGAAPQSSRRSSSRGSQPRARSPRGGDPSPMIAHSEV